MQKSALLRALQVVAYATLPSWVAYSSGSGKGRTLFSSMLNAEIIDYH